MSSQPPFHTGAGLRRSHNPPISAGSGNSEASRSEFVTQSSHFKLPSYPFQPLPTPNGPAPYRYDLAHLLSAESVQAIVDAGVLVFHTVGDTGDYRGQQKDFVAQMMTQDVNASDDGKRPAFFYHLGDVVYFAGDIDKYGDNFYETYRDYPAFIVSVPGNHDCQPDDPQDGPVDPQKTPLDGWIQNFMSKDPGQVGSLKTGVGRTQLDLPNVYWTFTTPFATIIGLFSNVGETQGEIHQDQIEWFQKELRESNPALALVVAVHHPPYSGDTEHSGSTAIHKVLFESFAATGVYPHLILSGHVHNYQRFTSVVDTDQGSIEVPCVVAGAGGYTKLGRLQTLDGVYPQVPLELGSNLTLEQYDQDNFGFLRLEISKTTIVGTYQSAAYEAGIDPEADVVDSFEIDIQTHTVQTVN